MHTTPNEGWNLFARLLEEILTLHGHHVSSLDDHAQIHPEKVRRLQQSLKVSKRFPVQHGDLQGEVVACSNGNSVARGAYRSATRVSKI